MRSLSRRRFLEVITATSVTGLATLRANAAPSGGSLQRWDGEALGADASISLAGLEPGVASVLLRAFRHVIGSPGRRKWANTSANAGVIDCRTAVSPDEMC